MTSSEAGDLQPDSLLAEVLARYPFARVSAVTVDGTPVPVPAGVDLGSGHLLSGTGGMKGYAPEDRSLLLMAFDEARRTGHGSAQVRLLQNLDARLTVHILDTIETHGVLLVVGAPSDDLQEVGTPAMVSPVAFPSRLARIYKSRTAQILGIDQATTEILGWTGEDMVGKRTLEFIHHDDQGLAIENWAVLVTDPAASRRVRVRHRASDGQWIWFDVAHGESIWQGQPCFVADMVDLTAEMRAQTALEAREQLLAELTQSLPLGVFQVDHDQRIVYTNNRLFTIMGTTQGETIPELVRWVTLKDKEDLIASLKTVMSHGGGCELDVHVEAPGEERQRVCQFTLHQLVSPAGSAHGVVGCVADITERTLLRQELEDRATFDPLTRCYTRGATMARLETTLSDDCESGSPTAVLFIDLDLFKSVNDRFGHMVGDEFLAATAGRIRGCLRNDAYLGRLGGDEFLVALPATESSEADSVAARISSVLGRDISLSVGVVTARASVGVAVSGIGATTVEALVTIADAAMYEAKRAQRLLVATD